MQNQFMNQFMFQLHIEEAIAYLNDAKKYLGEGGDTTTISEIVELLENILDC